MGRSKKPPAKRPATNGAPKKNGKRGKTANAAPPEVHPALRGEQQTIGLDETPHDPDLEAWGRELKKAQSNWAAWGRSATVLTEKIDTRMSTLGLKHYWHGGVELKAKATDPKTKIEVVIHDPEPVPAKAARA